MLAAVLERAVVQVRGEPLTAKTAKITLITLILSDPQESRPHRMPFHSLTLSSRDCGITHSPIRPFTHSPAVSLCAPCAFLRPFPIPSILL